MATKYHLYATHGIPELGIPPHSHVFWWPFERRYGWYATGPYDHGVILNNLEQGRLIPADDCADLSAVRQAAGLPPLPRPTGPHRGHLSLVVSEEPAG